MFIKKTLKKDLKSGKTYAAYHLVESVRTEKGPRQRTLLYMGSEIKLPEGNHKLLAQRIDELISGEQSLVPYPEDVEQLAQAYADQVVRRLSSSVDNDRVEKEAFQHEFVSIDIHSIEESDPRSIGTEHLLFKMSEQLELPEQLRELGFSKTDVSVALGSIIGRAARPDSERATHAWLCNDSGLSELLDFDFKKSSLDKLYQISDKLLTHKAVLENHLEAVEKKFHGYKNTVALYDLTNTYMEGQAKSNPKALHGLSKEKRNDCPLVTMGLVMNEHGFLNRTSILPGNASEPKTLERMIESLSDHQTLFKPTVILDAGIATEDNLSWLKANGYTYVVSARQNAPSITLEDKLVSVGDSNGLVKAALVKGEDESEEKWLYCESEAKSAVALEMKQSFSRRFECDLEKLSKSLCKPRGRKKYDKVVERIGRLKEKHKRISGCYDITIVPSEDKATVLSISWKTIEEKMEDKLTGRYFLRTNLLSKGAKELWQLYNTLRGIEDAFRFMKSSLGLRPVYHQKEHRVDGHLWITVLAYHLIQHCLYQLNRQGISSHWNTVRSHMMGRIRVTMQAQTEEGKNFYHRSSTKATNKQKEIYHALGMSPQILKARKTIL